MDPGYLPGIGGDKVVIHTGLDSLAAPWRREYSVILANPPFGKKQNLLFVNEEGDTEKEYQVIVREDFWTSTSNKQLNFVQHIYTLLQIEGRAAVVVVDFVAGNKNGEDWRGKLDQFLQFNERNVLPDLGQVSREQADRIAHEHYTRFEERRRTATELAAEMDVLKHLAETEKTLSATETMRKKKGGKA